MTGALDHWQLSAWRPVERHRQVLTRGGVGTRVCWSVSHATNGANQAGISCVGEGEILAGVSRTTNTGARALGRHGSGALDSSDDEGPGSGREQQNREVDLREPGRIRERHSLRGGTLYARFTKKETPGDWQALELKGG